MTLIFATILCTLALVAAEANKVRHQHGLDSEENQDDEYFYTKFSWNEENPTSQSPNRDAELIRNDRELGSSFQNFQSESSTFSASTYNQKFSSKPSILTPQALKAPSKPILNSKWSMRLYDGGIESSLNNTLTNITVSEGGSAFLPCRIGHLGDRQISWIRRKDWRVLASGKVLITHDPRFSILHEAGSQDWILHIKLIDVEDEGSYECQVSTGTGIISLFTNLSVVKAEAYISGHGQHHVNRGSPIVIKCFIQNSPTPPQYIFWYHNGKLLNFLHNRPELHISNLNAVDANKNITKNFFSKLLIYDAIETHSGNYTCTAPNVLPASTYVFVTEGDKTAAVQRIFSGSVSLVPSSLILILAFLNLR